MPPAKTSTAIVRRHLVVYFAHSMLEYGTERVARARAAARRRWPNATIFDPEQLPWEKLRQSLGSHEAVYRYVIGLADEVLVLERSQHVGRGVFDELSIALMRRLPCWALRARGFFPIRRVVPTGVDDWRTYFGQLHVGRLASMIGGSP